MQSIVREAITKIVTIENPMDKPVDIKKEHLTSDNENISFSPNAFTVPSHSEFGFEVIYRPLLVKDEQGKVNLKSPELGEFIYPLQLKGLAASTVQRTMSFKSSLGSDIIQTFKFQNYCRKPTIYQCRVDRIGPGGKAVASGVVVDPKAKGGPLVQVDFSVDVPNINAPAADSLEGSEVAINVRYEPSTLGESSAILILFSAEGGEYQSVLNGTAIAPQPKGPFKMAGAKPPPIEFKNPFFDAQEFNVRIDNPSFTTGIKNPVKVDGKKVLQINITYKAVLGTTNNGRLII